MKVSLTNEQIGEIISSQRGAKSAIAKTLKINKVSVTKWCQGVITSARIAAEAEKLARRLLAGEGL